MAFPVANPTILFWRTKLDDLDNYQSTTELPAEADIVVIGAGYSGASIVHHSREQKPRPLTIVILEAREACSRATGRNGGHLKPDPHYRAASALKKYGKDAAEDAASFEARQVKEVKDLVEKESIDCEFVITRESDVCLFEGARAELRSGLEILNAANVSTASNGRFLGSRAPKVASYTSLENIRVEDVDLPRLYRISQARLDSKHDVTLQAWEAIQKANALEAKSKL